MRIISLFLSALLMAGCATYSDRRQEQADRLNNWLGTTKDARVIKIGAPDRCTPLKSGGEACEWIRSGMTGGGSYLEGTGSSHVTTWEHRVVFTYDHEGIAKYWSYRGSF